jgi:hypothetical protein
MSPGDPARARPKAGLAARRGRRPGWQWPETGRAVRRPWRSRRAGQPARQARRGGLHARWQPVAPPAGRNIVDETALGPPVQQPEFGGGEPVLGHLTQPGQSAVQPRPLPGLAAITQAAQHRDLGRGDDAGRLVFGQVAAEECDDALPVHDHGDEEDDEDGAQRGVGEGEPAYPRYDRPPGRSPPSNGLPAHPRQVTTINGTPGYRPAKPAGIPSHPCTRRVTGANWCRRRQALARLYHQRTRLRRRDCPR